MTVLACLCTCPDTESAQRIATALVEERLSACVNILPGVTSVYRWQGRVERAGEILLLIKTTAGCYDALAARVQALHPYEVPELLALAPHAGLAAYLDWVASETGPEPTP